MALSKLEVLTVALALCACASASPPEEIVFPRLEMPESAVLMFESTAPADPDRSAGWRFYLDTKGCYFVARNKAGLSVDAARLGEDDPALFWNTPLPTEPLACLGPDALTHIQGRIDALEPDGLPTVSIPEQPASDAETVRWTFRRDADLRSVKIVDPHAWKSASLLDKMKAWCRIRRDLAMLHDQVRSEVESAQRAGE